MRLHLLLLILCSTVPVSSVSSFSSVFGAKRGKPRNQKIRLATEFVTTANHLIQGMMWLNDDELDGHGNDMLDQAARKMMNGMGKRGNKEDAMAAMMKQAREKKSMTAVAFEEHNFHATKHTEVRNEASAPARRKASVQQNRQNQREEETAGLSVDQRLAYQKQRRELGEVTAPEERVFCLNGLQAHRNATFECATRPGAIVSTLEWSQMPRNEQVQCSVKSSEVECICPRDINPSNERGVVVCDQQVPMQCSVNITEPSAAQCKPYVFNLDWVEPCHWYSTQDTLNVKVNLTCTFEYTENRYANLSDGVYVVQDYGAETYSLRTVDQTLLSFPQYATGIASRWGLSPGNWLLGNVSGTLGLPHRFSYKLYNFDRPSDNAWRFDKRVEDFEPGELTGEKPFEYSLQLSQVPERYFHGGRIYSEAGLLFSPNHTAKLLLDFTDYVPRGEAADSTSAMTGLILFIVLGIVFLVIGCVLWYINNTKVLLPNVDKYD